MHARRPEGKRTSTPSKGTRGGNRPKRTSTGVQPRKPGTVDEAIAQFRKLAEGRKPDPEESERDVLERDLTTLEMLAHLAVDHLEDAASEDRAVRRRYGALIGLLADTAEDVYRLRIGMG